MSASHSQPRRSTGSPAARVWLAALALVLTAVAAYHNTFGVPFVFDDVPAIVENPAIRQLWPAGATHDSEPAGGLTTSGRPVLRLTLALNHALGGAAVGGYHVVNLLIHVAAGLVLFALVRRTLRLPALEPAYGTGALPLAWIAAALWMLHPLQTESVTYIVQRAESLAGLFYLLTLYAFVRGTAGGASHGWTTFAVAACALGMASKEVMASAPIVVLLYDRTFVSGSFRAAWQRHRRTHLLLAATWLVLVWLILVSGGRGGTAGFGTAMSSWHYALTQCRALVHYFALSVWPSSLVFDYGLGTERSLVAVLPQALVIIAVVAGVIFASVRRPMTGFLGLCVLALLAPSSSFVPVATQTMAEHRMYLPLAPLIIGAVIASYRAIGLRAIPLLAAAAAALLVVTVERNRDYRSEVALWSDTTRKLPANARAHNNLGQALYREGRLPAAIAAYERALDLQPSYPETHYNLGVALAAQGRLDAAVGHYETALRVQPNYPEADNNLGNALVRLGRAAEAISHYEHALAVKPDFAEAQNNFGNALLQSGRAPEAGPHFQRALELKPDYAEAAYNWGNALAASGAMKDALARYEQALRLKPGYAEAHVNAGNAWLALGQPAAALDHYERAVTLDARLADAQFNYGSALLDLERWAEAAAHFEAVLRLNPEYARAERPLGFALAKLGRTSEAVPHYERYLRAFPDDTDARAEWSALRARAANR